MMPHDAAEHGRSLEQFCTKSAIALPKFRFGQSVACVWFHDDEHRWIAYYGFVIGIHHNHPDYLPGWSYGISFTDLPGSEWMDLPYFEVVHESELSEAKDLQVTLPTLRDGNLHK